MTATVAQATPKESSLPPLFAGHNTIVLGNPPPLPFPFLTIDCRLFHWEEEEEEQVERDTRALNSRPTVSHPFLPNCRHIQMSLFSWLVTWETKGSHGRSHPEKRKVEIGKLLRANGKRCVFIFEGLFLSTLRVRNRLAFLKAFFKCHKKFSEGGYVGADMFGNFTSIKVGRRICMAFIQSTPNAKKPFSLFSLFVFRPLAANATHYSP